MTESAQPGGLRERKKEATREALEREALRLFAARGFEATTVQDIVGAANVSERTFFRYFASKQDIILGDLIAALPTLLAALGERPLDEAPLDAIRAALNSLVRTGASPRPITLLGNPRASAQAGLQPRLLEVIADWEEQLAQAILERYPEADTAAARLRADVTARAALAAIRAALEAYRRGGPRQSRAVLGSLVADAFDVLAEGCAVAPPRS